MGVNEGSGVGEYNPTIDHVNNGEEASETVFRRPSINLENRTQALRDFINSEEIRINNRLTEHGGELDSHEARLNITDPLAASALQPFPVINKTADFTAATETVYTIAPVLATLNIQLPPPVNAAVITIKDISGLTGSEVITIVRDGGELIDTVAANYVLGDAFGSVTLVSDGTDWFLTSLGGGAGNETPVFHQEKLGVGNGINPNFILALLPTSETSIMVSANTTQHITIDWSYNSGSNQIEFVTPPALGVEIYVFYQTNGVPLSPPTVSGVQQVEYRTITPLEVTNKEMTLVATPAFVNKVIVDIIGGTSQHYTVDYTVAGDVLSWNGLLLDGIINAGDVLRIIYTS